jgi:phosphopantothenoylcysteine decarboxylase/phosphopantothenate--cysteine ligase
MTDTRPRLAGRKLLLGVSGGIAAYKSAQLIRLFRKEGADVRVLMTRDAGRFISALTLGTLSEHPVLTEIFPENEEGSWTQHIQLGLWADMFVIAPTTAQTLARLAGGFCDSMLTAVALAARCPILVCPSMDHDMYEHPATRANLDTIRSYGYHVLPAEAGELASGLVGVGRLPEPDSIVDEVLRLLQPREDDVLSGKQVLVTAGPTREPIDPIRFLTNHSTGTMGFEIARAAAHRGAQVTLVCGPTTLTTPQGVTRINVTTAREMHDAVMQHQSADIVFMAAAVADYRPAVARDSKIKKGGATMELALAENPDILKELGEKRRNDQILVGFAMETDDGPENARRKLREKHLDLIVLNMVGVPGSGFGRGTNKVTLISGDAERELPVMPKSDVADAIVELVADTLTNI